MVGYKMKLNLNKDKKLLQRSKEILTLNDLQSLFSISLSKLCWTKWREYEAKVAEEHDRMDSGTEARDDYGSGIWGEELYESDEY